MRKWGFFPREYYTTNHDKMTVRQPAETMVFIILSSKSPSANVLAFAYLHSLCFLPWYASCSTASALHQFILLFLVSSRQVSIASLFPCLNATHANFTVNASLH